MSANGDEDKGILETEHNNEELKDDMDLMDSINDDDHKITSPDSLVSPFKSKGMHRLANKLKEKENIREYSPSEVKMLDEKGKEIVEILQEEGTIK